MSDPTALPLPGLMLSEQTYNDEGIPGVDALQAQERYGTERAKRLRDDGDRQFIDISLNDTFRRYQDDPWAEGTNVKDIKTMFPGDRCKLLVLGAGFGGLVYAVKMVEAGIQPEDIRIVDTAGGFGGAWYWNRYPGINCDVESSCYLPLLEETGFVPTKRFSLGEEIRQYAEMIAQKWRLVDSAVLRTKAERLEWDASRKEWKIELVQNRAGEAPQSVTIRSQFVATVNGALNWPKLPDLPGIPDYRGKLFHSSRWDYSFTGGSPGDPSLENLKDKCIALVGTGSSGIQIAPHLARWAKHVYIVQRTPAAVDVRGQRDTDPEVFRTSVANKKGWQRERIRNYHQQLTTGKKPDTNLVNDGFTHATGMVTVAGNPDGPSTMEELPDYLKKLHAIDLPRQNRIRNLVKQTVKDPAVAEKLQAWYPTWCKRPGFSDDYLPIFNQDNVTLLDTDGKGVERLTQNAIIVNGQEYPVDAVIFATGFRAPFAGTPAEKANMKVIGRNGVSMTDSWAQNGPTTLHGIFDANFPNLFLSGPWQASIGPDNIFVTGYLAEEAAYVLTESLKKADGKPVEICSTQEAVQDWGMQIAMRCMPAAAAMGCTPGYFNKEGDLDRIPPEAQMQIARSGLWGRGPEDFVDTLAAWRAEGSMKGIEVLV